MKCTLPFSSCLKMEKRSHHIVLFVVLLAGAIAGGCVRSTGSPDTFPLEIHPEFFQPSKNLVSSQNSTYTYWTQHVWIPRNDMIYYGVEATLDVHSLTLQPGQLSEGGVWITTRGDGQPSSINAIQLGWHIHPRLYKDSHAHFYVAWATGAYPGKGCFNMICPGFQKTSSIIAPGDVIHGNTPSITVKIFKDKSSGDWHVHYGVNSSPKPVGYFPKSLLPGMKDALPEIRFGGFVSHEKPTPSPPMGSGHAPFHGNAATISSINLIDADDMGHTLNTNLPAFVSREECYPLSNIDHGRFLYGGPGCAD